MSRPAHRKQRRWSDSPNWGCIGLIAYFVVPIVVVAVLLATGVISMGDGADGRPDQCVDAHGFYPC